MWNHAKNSMKTLKRPNSLFLHCEISSVVLKTRKIRKTGQTKTWITQNFQILYPIQGGTMWKLLSYPKMWYFWGLAVFKVELLAVEVGSKIKKKIDGKAALKKRHGHNFDFWALKRIARLNFIVENTFYSFQASKIKIVAVSFFLRRLFSGTEPKFQSLLTLSSYNSR